jgi:phosphotransferase system enzyme I (PtsI)
MTPLLIGLGIDELSMSASSILKIREIVSKIQYTDAANIAKKALNMNSSKEVEKLIESKFN